jgi:hypothetical protein
VDAEDVRAGRDERDATHRSEQEQLKAPAFHGRA